MVATVAGVIAVALAGVWSQRTSIATGFIDRELVRRGVPATYRITRFGIGGQRLEQIRIGDPAHPDLTAERADVRIAIGLNGPEVRAVSASGVRLFGRLVDGKLSLGAIDRLLPPPTGAPFTLPDLDVTLRDARMLLKTAGGPVGIAVEGTGRLSDGFTGRMAATTSRLDVAGCTITDGRAFVNMAIVERRPALDGPVSARSIACPENAVRIEAPSLAVDVELSAALDRWTGGAGIEVRSTRQGRSSLDGVTGRIEFAGTSQATGGDINIAARRLATVGIGGGRAGFKGQYRIGRVSRVMGDLRLVNASADDASRRAILAAGVTGSGTPAGPIARVIADAGARAAGRFDAAASIDLVRQGSAGTLRLARISAASASGATLVATQGAGLGIDWPSGAIRVDGRLAIAGGGMPTVDAALAQAGVDAPIRGLVRVADYRADDAVLRLTPIRFDAAPGASRFTTILSLDGPVASGRIQGLTLPITGRLGHGGSFVVNAGCAPLTFDHLSLSGLEVGRSVMRLCPDGRGVLYRGTQGGTRGAGRIAGPKLSGTLGGSPVTITAGALRFDIAGPDFVADRLAVGLGPADGRTTLDIDRFAGSFVTGGMGGRFAGLSGQIVNVPLLMSEGAGYWRLIGEKLSVAGDVLRVADAAAEPRFNPLVSRNVVLSLVDNVIDTTGTLVEPETGSQVTDVVIRHDLNQGAGTATLDVPGVTFGPALQPEKLTRLTLGVVANVKGTVSGRGEIGWNRQESSSTGTFRTEGMDLAAAFGPVSGLSTTVRFDDLLGLHTPPGQVATVREINPGIAVRDGIIRYQLLRDQRVKIEGGRWPFSGGELLLDPTLLDFSGPSERRLTFHVTGMDAAQFIEQFDFKNIAVTGTFDGILPMIFDERGGRIVGGRLVVRKGGGTLAYVGEVSNADLGTWGKLAFDALKSMRYRALTIELDGALDGELVSRVLFDGTNQTPHEAIAKNGLLSQFSNLPFRFNITIRAPFRGLLNSAQSLNDPRGLIRQALPRQEPPLPGSVPVQTQESEGVR